MMVMECRKEWRNINFTWTDRPRFIFLLLLNYKSCFKIKVNVRDRLTDYLPSVQNWI